MAEAIPTTEEAELYARNWESERPQLLARLEDVQSRFETYIKELEEIAQSLRDSNEDHAATFYKSAIDALRATWAKRVNYDIMRKFLAPDNGFVAYLKQLKELSLRYASARAALNNEAEIKKCETEFILEYLVLLKSLRANYGHWEWIKSPMTPEHIFVKYTSIAIPVANFGDLNQNPELVRVEGVSRSLRNFVVANRTKLAKFLYVSLSPELSAFPEMPVFGDKDQSVSPGLNIRGDKEKIRRMLRGHNGAVLVVTFASAKLFGNMTDVSYDEQHHALHVPVKWLRFPSTLLNVPGTEACGNAINPKPTLPQ